MTEKSQYQVLARKYRPSNFHDLIGQEFMVRVLSNAFSSGRVAHAFMLTGVRGIGKTTTARIIAKGLNCTGAEQSPTTDPCGQCPSCISIGEGRNMDVLELDAASNTQVDKMREILASVPYRPTESRYKVYIFDEVHMLSTAAFNAILKTLEEPPEHVKFIFATTEIRKVPITVLSRCQRFDLRRISGEAMVEHLKMVAQKEDVSISEPALKLIARASEGSVRDALSILDQALAMSQGEVRENDMRQMMGLSNQSRILELFEAIMGGNVSFALTELRAQYHDGAEPQNILKELAELTHLVSLLKVADDIDDDVYSQDQLHAAQQLADRLTLPVLARQWQMLLKLGAEIDFAPNRLMGAEMAIIRLCHISNEPPPSVLLEKLQNDLHNLKSGKAAISGQSSNGTRAHLRAVGDDLRDEDMAYQFPSYVVLLEKFRENREFELLFEIERTVQMKSYAPGVLHIGLAQGAAKDFLRRFEQALYSLTGKRWLIRIDSDFQGATIEEERNALEQQKFHQISEHPTMKALQSRHQSLNILKILPKLPQNDESEADWEAIDLEDE